MDDGLHARIESIRIRGFRSLADVQVDLPPVAVLIGANGSGKSYVMRFFQMLGWMLWAATARPRRASGSSHCCDYRKRLHGPLITEDIGLPTLPVECRRFGAWMARLERPDR